MDMRQNVDNMVRYSALSLTWLSGAARALLVPGLGSDLALPVLASQPWGGVSFTPVGRAGLMSATLRVSLCCS